MSTKGDTEGAIIAIIITDHTDHMTKIKKNGVGPQLSTSGPQISKSMPKPSPHAIYNVYSHESPITETSPKLSFLAARRISSLPNKDSSRSEG